ncbi:MAG: hypothetical protein WDW38_008979 [Sanguina aurantia]
MTTRLFVDIKKLCAELKVPADRRNARFFPSADVIRRVAAKQLTKLRAHQVDHISVDMWLASLPPEVIWFWRKSSAGIELLLILQTAAMRERLLLYGGDIVLADSTYKTQLYNLPLFILCVIDNHGRGYPVAFVLVESESTIMLAEALQWIKDENPLWNPRFFMMDRADAEINAFRQVFTEAIVRVCKFHRAQAVNRWLAKTENGATKTQHLKKDRMVPYPPYTEGRPSTVVPSPMERAEKARVEGGDLVPLEPLESSRFHVEKSAGTITKMWEADTRDKHSRHLPDSLTRHPRMILDASLYGMKEALDQDTAEQREQHFVREVGRAGTQKSADAPRREVDWRTSRRSPLSQVITRATSSSIRTNTTSTTAPTTSHINVSVPAPLSLHYPPLPPSRPHPTTWS